MLKSLASTLVLSLALSSPGFAHDLSRDEDKGAREAVVQAYSIAAKTLVAAAQGSAEGEAKILNQLRLRLLKIEELEALRREVHKEAILEAFAHAAGRCGKGPCWKRDVISPAINSAFKTYAITFRSGLASETQVTVNVEIETKL